jgi:hypothetical protein
MKHCISVAVLSALVAAPVIAQSPEGWMVRVDRSTNASDPDAAGDVTFTMIPGGYHAVNPSAAVFWNPANTATGTYTVKGNFKLMEPSGHVNYYGLVFGGSALEGTDQSYLYFLVAQNGTFLIKRRDGDSEPDPDAARGRRGGGRGLVAVTEDIVGRTASDAVRQPGADGTSENMLEVRVMVESIDYVVNGTVVHTTPKTGLTAVTDGIAGIRVNHRMNVQITGFEITR